MKAQGIIFVTKDALNRGYLPVYGNSYWKTPNIDELAARGTVFTKYYTAAPSTIMSNMCMFTGKYAHESELSNYIYSHIHYSGETLFDRAEQMGMRCHIILDEAWKSVFRMEERYYCYGERTNIHYLEGVRQGVGAHYSHKGFLQANEEKTRQVYALLRKELKKIIQEDSKVFVWLHIPHVINGRIGYGQDMDAFDHIIGMVREYFDDDSIFISADHGNMNGEKNKLGYGFDVYNPSVLIPLITPRINDLNICDWTVSNIDISTILLDGTIPRREVVYSDNAFYAQPNRKLAIINDNYKYIYNKLTREEELYDLRTDPQENANLMFDYSYDKDRGVRYPLRELYFYPYWDEIEQARKYFKDEKDKIWKNGSFREEWKPKIEYWEKQHIYPKVSKYITAFRSRKKE